MLEAALFWKITKGNPKPRIFNQIGDKHTQYSGSSVSLWRVVSLVIIPHLLFNIYLNDTT